MPNKTALFRLGGQYDYHQAIEWEKIFQWLMFELWVIFNIGFAGWSLYLLAQREEKCGRIVSKETKIKKKPKSNTTDNNTTSTIKKDSKSNAPVTSTDNTANKKTIVVNSCPCEACKSRQRHEYDDLQKQEKYLSKEEKQMTAAVVNAGLGLELTNLVSVFIKAGINLKRMKSLPETLLYDMLGNLRVKPEDRIDLIVSAKEQVDLLFLQGSASYMYTHLGLAGKMTTLRLCLYKIDTKIESTYDHTLKDFTNMLYGYQLLNSSATPAVNVLSKRTCRSINGPIYSQLWAGFAAAEAEKLKQGEEQKIVIVDLGSGEFKRFLCTLGKGKPIKLEKELKDLETPEQYSTGLEELKKILVQHYKADSENKHPTGPALDVYEARLDDVINAMLSGDQIEQFITNSENVTAVHFLATSSTRKYFTSQDAEPGGDDAGNAEANNFILKIIREKLKEKLGDGGERVVNYKLLQQEDEAKYEFHAAKAAIHHAFDIPLEAQRCSSFGALAWGNGSCQGYTTGLTTNEGKESEPLKFEIGLKEVTEIVKKFANNIDNEHVEIYKRDEFDEKKGKDVPVTRIRFAGKHDGASKKTGKVAPQHLHHINRLRKEVGEQFQKKIQLKVSIPVKFFDATYDL
jgi:hypothetical protein